MSENLIINSATIKVEEGIMEFRTNRPNYLIRVSFEAIEQFHEKIESYLVHRRELGLIEGEIMQEQTVGN